ncbi:protein FAM13A isoform X5 [Neolamprologus brichardi]|uniref:protein FAM13A isoform X5 n=1 Tax=Neolamprologus brichardi TaxID=32507 RepID=UPI0003EC6749|nr:protein FAM13A isoform X5 [Neolamprologus brichardi]
MGAGAMTICHNKAAVQVKEDMKKMVQMPIPRPRIVAPKHTKVFGVSLFELRNQGLLEDGVPLVVRRMVEHLRKHALHQEGLFRVNGNVRAVETLKQHLEGGGDVNLLSESDSCTVASLLKQYLRDLPGGLVVVTVQQALIQLYQERGGDGDTWADVRHLLLQLPDVHYSLLHYLCHFLTLVESSHKDNRMTALNLATVFGPSVFHVAPGFEALKNQNICNKIMAKLIQNYNNIFETNTDREDYAKEEASPIIAEETQVADADTKNSSSHLDAKTTTPLTRMKVKPIGHLNQTGNAELPKKSCTNAPNAKTRKKKVRKGKIDGMTQVVPQPSLSSRAPYHARPFSIPIVLPLTSELRTPSAEAMEATPMSHQATSDTASHVDPHDVSLSESMKGLSSSQDEDRPVSPFYMSNHLSPVHCRPGVVNFLDRTIRSAVEQHLFDVNPLEDQHSDAHESTPCPSRVTLTARQRRRHQREQQHQEEGQKHREKNRAPSVTGDTNKENVPSSGGSSSGSVGEDMSSRVDSQEGQRSQAERTPKPRKPKKSPTLMQLSENTAAHATLKTMKIQESPVTCDAGRVGGEVRGPDSDCEKTSCEDVPRLDLTALTEDNNWGEPTPAYSLQRESMDREEARLSPHCGGRLIRQLLEESSDPMVSPRFYAYGHSQQYLDDTEVPPSPPNAHSFISRRRSSSLGSCDDEREELTSAQLTKRIHILKKKIHRFEEKYEEERKYRPSHSDKAANPEVLRWMNELARLRKELKEHKLMKSEEDLTPQPRQRSNTLPKSFGSQLEKKPQQEKASKPPVESTLEGIQKKLQEKRDEVNRPEDIKDMTREQIAAEKVALQKALLYYESIHGRPMTKSERQIMKPVYDRYRLVKQILCRASTIPVIGSPSSKRRGPLLQPIIEGETALFFDDIKEEEDGSEDDGDSKTQFTVTVRPDIGVFSFLEHADEEVDGFISPVDELSPSKNTMDTRLSNLHSATMQELVEQLQETREEKKRIRKNLKEFEDQFFRQNGRNVQKEDRSPLAVEYNEYKHVKAKLRLLEVLISKRDSTKFI